MLASLVVATRTQVEHWRTSQTLFEQALRVEPQNSVARTGLGVAMERQGDVEAAIEHYRQAVKIEPTYIPAQSSLAHALMETSQEPGQEARRKEAIAITKTILAADPRNAFACNLRGNVLREAKRYDESLQSLQIAVEVRPYDVTIRSNLAATLYDMGRRDEAQRQLDEARRLDAENPTLLLNQGVIEFQNGNVRKAIELFEHSERMAPEYSRAKRYQASARLTLGALAMQQGKFSEAVREFEQSDKLEPRVWQLQVNFGEAHLQLNQLKLAEHRFLNALDLHPQCAEAHFGLGRVYANMQQLELAVKHLTTALKLKPDFQPAQELLNSLKNSGNGTEAK
jgi:protein O-GlcNAc transferase